MPNARSKLADGKYVDDLFSCFQSVDPSEKPAFLCLNVWLSGEGESRSKITISSNFWMVFSSDILRQFLRLEVHPVSIKL